MNFYIIKLLVLLPVMGLLIFGALWLYRKYQPALMQGQNARSIRLVETMPMGSFCKLAVVEFDDKRLLLSISRNSVSCVLASEKKP